MAEVGFAVAGGRGSVPSVERRALVERLDEAVLRPVTVVSAPAGSGKTMLLRSWAAHRDGPLAWVSVARGERDPQRFWSSVVEALAAAAPAGGIAQLSPSPGFDGQALVERLVVELAVLPHDVVLVVDDVHELSSPEPVEQLSTFLERLPETVRVVLATRRDLRLPLHRRRVEGELTEVRAADLRFSLDEARELLAASGVELSETVLATLHERTEGWAAGLRLAALSLAEESDPAAFVAAFSGSERTVAEYLLGEVLDRQPDDVRRLLLRTSVLERVSGPVADALTGASGSERILQSLADAEAFVVALDPARTWFRYHRLFADLLRLELRRSAPDSVKELHARAARWHSDHGNALEAIRHAEAADDSELAVGLLGEHIFALLLNGSQATAHELLESVASARGPADPELAVLLALDELWHGALDSAARQIALAERHGGSVPAERAHRFAAMLSLARLSLARRRGDFDSVRDLVAAAEASNDAETWSDLALDDDLRTLAVMNLGIVEAWSGRGDDGARHLEEARALARSSGRAYLDIACLAHWSFAMSRVSFHRAETACREAIASAEQRGWDADPVIAPALIGLAVALLQTGRFEEAQESIDRAERIVRAEVEPAAAFVLYAVRGAAHAARGRAEEAIAAYDRAERLTALLVSHPPLALQLRCARALAELMAGRRDAAGDALAGLSEAERDSGEARAVLAALALDDDEPEAALALLEPLVEGRAAVHHVNVVVRGLLFAALAHDRLGDAREAEATLERALDLAEPDSLALPFADTSIGPLLARHPRHRSAHGAFIKQLLDIVAGGSAPAPRQPAAPLSEPLTDMEMRVLRYLPTNLSATEIGGEIYVSVNTVKTHMRHLYAKLDVHTRAEAVARGRELGLLAQGHRRG